MIRSNRICLISVACCSCQLDWFIVLAASFTSVCVCVCVCVGGGRGGGMFSKTVFTLLAGKLCASPRRCDWGGVRSTAK